VKTSILIDMLFDFLSKRKVTAAYLAEKYDISPRTVYRYVEILSQKIPLRVKRGRSGGIYLYDSYRLPVGFLTENEYNAATEALSLAYANSGNARFLEARRKLLAEVKTEFRDFSLAGDGEEILIEDSSFENAFIAENIRILKECVRDSLSAEILYLSENNERETRKIEPHVLICDKNIWYIYAFFHYEREFLRFPIGKILSVCKTDENFHKRSFEREDILSKGKPRKILYAQLEVKATSVDAIANRFGGNVFHRTKGKWIAEIPLTDNDETVKTLLHYGAEIKVLTPKSLQARIRALSRAVYELYT